VAQIRTFGLSWPHDLAFCGRHQLHLMDQMAPFYPYYFSFKSEIMVTDEVLGVEIGARSLVEVLPVVKAKSD
jgi:hypothetical protein